MRSTPCRRRCASCGGRAVQVLVAMSGGVDSSVAAALLRDEGHEVVGVTMKLWGGASDTGCCSVADVDDARRAAQQLGIDHVVFNFTSDFEHHVVVPYVAAHRSGQTPNPCVECNRHLKFDRLLDRADRLGFDAVATGHHARIVGGRVARGADRAKDQSYVLHVLDRVALERTRFPIGELNKSEVRRLATDLGLRTAQKPDSQDVCFITAIGGRAAFLAERIPLRPATVVDSAGRRIGEVPSVELVTVGQRKGLGLGGAARPRFVVDVDAAGAVVTVGSLHDLMVTDQPLRDLRWIDGSPSGDVLVQCSAHGRSVPATVEAGRVRWAEPQRRVAAGQSIVVYDAADQIVLGGGIAA
jgi:tRNA-uridine 2-sulfurtransferase